jgi:hypothetical protein
MRVRLAPRRCECISRNRVAVRAKTSIATLPPLRAGLQGSTAVQTGIPAAHRIHRAAGPGRAARMGRPRGAGAHATPARWRTPGVPVRSTPPAPALGRCRRRGDR